MKYKAIFFDRDGTLTYFDESKEKWRDNIIEEWSGKTFELPYEKMMKLFNMASEGKKPWYKTLYDERNFFKRYYKFLLVEEGVVEQDSFLVYITHDASEIVKGSCFYVHTINQDCAFLYIVIARYQIYHSRFSRT